MLELILDGECHNGSNPRHLGPWHWQFEARGDNAHYCYYFHFTLEAHADGEAVIDIAPDSRLLPDCLPSFRRHQPEAVWLSRGAGWERHPTERDAPPDCIRLRLPVSAGETVSVSRMYPYPYSEVVSRIYALQEHIDVRAAPLGMSAAEREIPGLEIGEGGPQILILSGQHPAEFGGIAATLGIADWLLSHVPEVEALRQRYSFLLVPLLNPDGNVTGRTGCNSQGDDLYRAFADASEGLRPTVPEAARLWERIWSRAPVLSLNFHSYTQPLATGTFPWEGLYTVEDEAFAGHRSLVRQRRLDDLLAWETEGLTQHGEFSRHAPESLEYQLARIGVLNAFYEVQDAVGPIRHRRTGVQVLKTALRALEP